MTRIIAVLNHKGGVGKTTTVVNLSACLAEQGKKVLVVDADAQGNTTSGLGLEKNQIENTLYNVLLGEISAAEAVQETIADNVELIPSNMNLSGAEIELVGLDNREYIMKECLENIKDDYDFVMIDCPPSLGLVTLNALTAADTVLVPVQCEYYALEGLTQLMVTIKQVKRLYNRGLDITGILVTMYNGRLNLSLQVMDELKKYYAGKLFSTTIMRNVRLSEAPGFGMPVMYFDKYSKGCQAYLDVAEELITRI